MQKRPTTISVITVCYNALPHLKTTLQSVVEQSYPHIEYIVVDGGSSDGTPQFLANAQQKGQVSQYLSEPDGGIYNAMNKGLALASGDYVCFLNAGDTLHSPTTLSELFGSLNEGHLPTVIYGDTMLVDNTGCAIGVRSHRPPMQLTRNSFRRGMVVCHQSFYALRQVAPTYNEAYRFSADVDWCLRILSSPHCTAHNSHLILTNYLNEGATTRNRWASLRERYKIMCHHYGVIGTLFSHLFFVLRWPIKYLRRLF